MMDIPGVIDEGFSQIESELMCRYIDKFDFASMIKYDCFDKVVVYVIFLLLFTIVFTLFAILVNQK